MHCFVAFCDGFMYNEQNINKWLGIPGERNMKIWIKLSACLCVFAAYILLLVLRPFSAAGLVLGALVCNWFANAVHELGHLIAYRLLKLKWKRMVISFFVFEAGQGVRFEKDRGIYAASCTCAYAPETAIWRYDLALLCGGLLGCVTGIGALLAAMACGGSLAAFLQCFGAVSIINGIYNLLPFSADRRLMKEIRKEREKAK